ncbi:16S rRNA (uracil(1498)-N(3))-methyltransferase [Neiella marina]|uniref:Ribosomal RNA small subunit methyltransferase E n=1 Tax=Neiella holothuriorum TaxID=2870530 RepID=A0ABS7EK19_9GAMM|nr:16S rRNA (uracil(1498)-N(3))-methyltransferase [Neiella holothuriorum]MBW8192670.1 16S rRNA (uracil(1498)-N(3))-methyltransferase [Neiella holothuriorum]
MTTRIFHPEPLNTNTQIQLSDSAAGHVARVLRMRVGDAVELFDGSGFAYSAELTVVEKRRVVANITTAAEHDRESPLKVHIGQGVSRGDKMDFTIQKAVELGVDAITPLLTERCGVKLQAERWQKKVLHWQQIAISACEQCGRNKVPAIHQPLTLSHWLEQPSDQLKLNLHPKAAHGINGLTTVPDSGVRLLIGPEGGLSDIEIEAAQQHSYQSILMGPRVLRTETAALTALTALQTRFGDLG